MKKQIQDLLQDWHWFLQGYDYTVIHRKGVANTYADSLSRREYDPEKR